MNGRTLALLACLLVVPQSAPVVQRSGEVTYVRDGDTIELGSMAIRFEGIAAPEWNEPGGAEATEAIEALVLGKEVRCELTGKRTYDRCVAVCYLNGADVEAIMVRNGFARDCPRYSCGALRPPPTSRAQRTPTSIAHDTPLPFFRPNSPED